MVQRNDHVPINSELFFCFKVKRTEKNVLVKSTFKKYKQNAF